MVGCDVFVLNEKSEVLLVRRSDNGFWCLPGGSQDLGETPKQCAERECHEESGYEVEITELRGVFSSECYAYVNYPWPENNFTHILFSARIIGGAPRVSSETTEVAWFPEHALPKLSDGHEPRIKFGFASEKARGLRPHFE